MAVNQVTHLTAVLRFFIFQQKAIYLITHLYYLKSVVTPFPTKRGQLGTAAGHRLWVNQSKITKLLYKVTFQVFKFSSFQVFKFSKLLYKVTFQVLSWNELISDHSVPVFGNLSRAVFYGRSRGSSKVLLGPAILYHSMHFGRPTPGQSNSRPRVGQTLGKCTILFQRTPGPPMKCGPGLEPSPSGRNKESSQFVTMYIV
jgi:hypothetical protein